MRQTVLSHLRAFVGNASKPTYTPEQVTAAACLARVRAELPELLGAAVIDLASGRALATCGRLPAQNLAQAAPFNAELVRQKQQALKNLRLPSEQIEDILITLRGQQHLLRLSADGQRVLFLAIETEDANMALARLVLRENCA